MVKQGQSLEARGRPSAVGCIFGLVRVVVFAVFVIAGVSLLLPRADSLLFPLFDLLNGYPIEWLVIVPFTGLLLSILYRAMKRRRKG